MLHFLFSSFFACVLAHVGNVIVRIRIKEICSSLLILFHINVCRYQILYPLRLRPPFPNDAKILRPNVGFRPNQILNRFEKY